jgi:hypothetical protein
MLAEGELDVSSFRVSGRPLEHMHQHAPSGATDTTCNMVRETQRGALSTRSDAHILEYKARVSLVIEVLGHGFLSPLAKS